MFVVLSVSLTHYRYYDGDDGSDGGGDDDDAGGDYDDDGGDDGDWNVNVNQLDVFTVLMSSGTVKAMRKQRNQARSVASRTTRCCFRTSP